MPIKLEKTTIILKYVILSFWGVWVFLSLTLLLNKGSGSPLIYYYIFYLVFGTIILVLTRKDIFSPPGIFTLAGFLAFGFNIPLISAGLVSGVHIDDVTLTKVMIVFLCAKVAFMIGYMLWLHKFLPTCWIVNLRRPSREASIFLYVLLACYVVVAGLIRINYHLGEAGAQPTIPFAGYFQYTLYEGVLILCLWYLSQGLIKGNAYILLGLSLLLGIAVTQALLGWRSGIVQVFFLVLILFWYQKKMYKKQKVHSFVWLFLLVIFLGSIMELGNEIRVKRLGGDSKFTTDKFVNKIFMRGQGTTRLAAVVNHFGPITLTNNFLLNNLASKGLTTTKYIDRRIYGVEPRQSHSVGTSGPGGPYTGLGLLGVSASFVLLGAFYRSVYENIFLFKTGVINPLGVVLYSMLITALITILTENFNLSTVRMLTAIVFQIFIYRLIIVQEIKASKYRDELIA